MVDLGTLGGTSSSALFVDASGQVVGTSYTAGDAAFHVFRWTAASGMVDLGTLGGTSSFVGEAFPGPERWFTPVNSKGQVVGASTTASDAEWHAFSWTARGGMVDLGALGGSYTVAVGVSASGQVVGWSAIAGDSTIHAFSWTPADGMVDLRTLSGSGQSLAFGVNAAGQVVGSSTTAGAAGSHPFMWTASGGMVDLGTIGGTYGSAYSINNNGIAAGESTLANESLHATLWQLPRPPRCGTARPDRPVLWPPNHKLVPVQIVGISDPDNHSLTTTITGVTQDEPGNSLGDGNTSRDAIIQETGVLLRAERAGGINGRVYRVHFRADNGLGGVCTGSVPVIVPKNMKSGRAVIDDGQRYDSTRQ